MLCMARKKQMVEVGLSLRLNKYTRRKEKKTKKKMNEKNWLEWCLYSVHSAWVILAFLRFQI